ncbi:MAG TPA: hypothetical protein PLI01_00350 [Nitrospira sp.]|nr:hypothetical protein [Nitrospira sp.]HNA25209.1 hypothetical protein [Nitrospira sp.]HNI17499.1 hypothetical protein [Nitrospira sp.]
MKFQSSAKNLRLIKRADWIEPVQGAPAIRHAGEYITFTNGVYETEDEKEIEWLKAHKLFSVIEKAPQSFWVYREPIDISKVLKDKDEEIARLNAENESLKAENDGLQVRLNIRKSAKEKAPAEPPAPPVGEPQVATT